MLLRPDAGCAMEGIGDSCICAADAVHRTADMSPVMSNDKIGPAAQARCMRLAEALPVIAAKRLPSRRP
jgi:hypothetical protein